MMENEQRIQALEQEVQLLKAQIQATLLDIQAQLLTNAYPALRSEGQAGAEASRPAAARETPPAAPAPVKRVSLDTFGELPPDAPATPPAAQRPAAPPPAPAPVMPAPVMPPAAPMPMPTAPRAAGPIRSMPAAPVQSARQAPAASPLRRAPAVPQRPAAARQVPAESLQKRGPRLSPKTRQASLRSHRRGDHDKLLPFEDLGAPGAAASMPEKPRSPLTGQRSAGGPSAPPSLPGPTTAQGMPEAAGDSPMSSADIEPLNQWLQGKIEKYGIDRTRSLLDMYVRKEYLKPEVIAVLVRLLDKHEDALRPQAVLTNAKPRFMQNGVGRLTSTVALEGGSAQPLTPEAEKRLSSRKLVLRLIAGVQNAGMSWVTRDENRG